jgi:hypothetical protein
MMRTRCNLSSEEEVERLPTVAVDQAVQYYSRRRSGETVFGIDCRVTGVNWSENSYIGPHCILRFSDRDESVRKDGRSSSVR